MNEIWQPIQGFIPYEVSDLGRIRNGKTHRIFKLQIIYSGYLTTQLKGNSVREGKFVHRLVAQAFISNPLNLPEVNHLDGNKLNCVKSNLEWSTRVYNMQHASVTGLLKNSGYTKRPISQYDLNMRIIKNWNSIAEVDRSSQGQFDHRGISNVCAGRRKTYKGFIWKYI